MSIDPRPDDGRRPADVVVIGIGNPFQRDDGVGFAIAQRLSAQRLPGVRFAFSDGEAAGLIELWDGARLAVVVDVLRTEQPVPGRIHRMSVIDASAPDHGHRNGEPAESTDFGEAVELAKILGRLPRRLVLFAVEAGDVGFGTGLTSAVAAAAGRVAVEIVHEVALAA